MPSTFNGTGTMYYGEKDIEPDKSFVTTEWIVLFFVPIIPIGSFRVLETGHENIIFGSSTQYLVRRIPLDWKQIRNVYAVSIGVIGLITVASYLHNRLTQKSPNLNLPVNQTIQVNPSLNLK